MMRNHAGKQSASNGGRLLKKLSSSFSGRVFPRLKRARNKPALLAVIAGLSLSAGISRASADTVTVTVVTGEVDQFNAAGSGSVFASGEFQQPTGIAIDAAGNTFVASLGDSKIFEFTPSGQSSLFADSSQLVSSPNGLAFDSAGNLFVANAGSDNILRITPGGGYSVFAPSLSSSENLPRGLAFNAAGDLYVSYGGDSTPGSTFIMKYSPLGIGTLFASGLDLTTGLAVDASGNLYAAVTGDSSVERFTPSGVGSIFIPPGKGLMRPPDLDFGSDGSLYVANSDSTIYRFTPDGSGSLFAQTLNGAPTNGIVVEAVPEPSAWLSFAAISAAALFVIIRRRLALVPPAY